MEYLRNTLTFIKGLFSVILGTFSYRKKWWEEIDMSDGLLEHCGLSNFIEVSNSRFHKIQNLEVDQYF